MVDVTQLLKIKILKLIFLLCLICVCCFGFNFPSLKQFLDGEVIIHESVEKPNALRPPAITICPKKWKTESAPRIDTAHYENHCANASTTEDYMGCVNNNTYGFEDMIQYARHGYSAGEDLTDWSWDLTFAAVGRCYRVVGASKFQIA